MITSSAEAIERLKQLLDNIDDEIETHVRGRDLFIASLTIETNPAARLQAEQHVSTEIEVIHVLYTLIHRSTLCPCGMCDRSAASMIKAVH
jgi:vacuolar-type H+-ATPase subunit B/Vma2